jgi:hypothetical protein
MRIVEFTSAQEQMALLKLIFDKTWETLGTQAKQQAQAKASQQRTTKPTAKRKGLKRVGAPVPKPLAPKVPAPSITKHTPQPTQASPQQKYRNSQPAQLLRQPSAQQKPTPLAPTLKTSMPNLPSSQNLSVDSKPTEYDEKYAAFKEYGEGDDKHSKNTFK